MNSTIHTGSVWHDRFNPVRHRFGYPFVFVRFDLDELALLDRTYPWFGLNRFAPWSIRNRDYIQADDRPIKEKIMAFWQKEHCTDEVERIDLVTVPRVFGYAFNPVSFYLGLDARGRLRCAAAEVNNTFKEKHLYVLPTLAQHDAQAPYTAQSKKVFHVSPFYDRSGDYFFRFFLQGNLLRIDVDKTKHGGTVFRSGMSGPARPFTSSEFMKTITRYPFTATLAMPRILIQAVKLHYGKKLPVHRKPLPSDAMTIGKAPASFFERRAMALVFTTLEKLEVGRLTFTFPDGTSKTFGGRLPGQDVQIKVTSYRAFTRMLRNGSVGFGEAYTEGELETAHVTRAIQLFIENAQHRGSMQETRATIGNWINRRLHLRRSNSLKGSRDNIHAHYNLSNELFTRFLSPELSYSSAVFDPPELSLEEAQSAKHSRIIRKANLGPEDHVLEIGCGWGGFAIQAVQQTGCRVTGLTLSQEQKTLAEKRIRQAGLKDRIEIRLQDYREIQGQYDAIVSIEMLEAVGHEFYPHFFKQLNHLLKPGGKAVIQSITIPHERYTSYLNGCDWIQKYIFPGGHLPSEEIIQSSTQQWSNLRLVNLERIGPHYATTLAKWRERFLANWNTISSHGFDERFYRMWLYYLGYCEAGFLTGYINNAQVVLEKPL